MLQLSMYILRHLFLCPFFNFCQTSMGISLSVRPVIPSGLTGVEMFLLFLAYIQFLNTF